MSEKQRTFGDIVGMESEVPTAQLSTDIVECSDGAELQRCDAVPRNTPRVTDHEKYGKSTIVNRVKKK